MQVGLGRRPRRLRDHLALPCLCPLRRSPSIQSAALGLSGVRRTRLQVHCTSDVDFFHMRFFRGSRSGFRAARLGGCQVVELYR